MKATHYLFLTSISFSFLLSCNAPDSDKAKTTATKEVAETTPGTKKYTIDTEASEITWIGTKVSGYHSGPIKIKKGELEVDNGTISGGNFIMDMTTITATGPKKVDVAISGKLTGHLKSADFFDVEKYPEATFTITGVRSFTGTVNDADEPKHEEISKYKVTHPTHTVSGNLVIKGISKNIEFPAQLSITDHSLEAIAKFSIDRTQWNIKYTGKPDDLIRKEIYFGISLKATK